MNSIIFFSLLKMYVIVKVGQSQVNVLDDSKNYVDTVDIDLIDYLDKCDYPSY